MGRPATSCDSCRRSRLGCNISISPPGQPCYNCSRRGVACSRRSIRVDDDQKRGKIDISATATASDVQVDNEVGPVRSSYTQPEAAKPAGIPSSRTNQRASQDPNDYGYHLTQPCSESPSVSDPISKFQQAQNLHGLLWNVFTSVLEPRIGLWISHAPPTTRIFSLMTELDRLSTRFSRQAGSPQPNNGASQPMKSDGDLATDTALMFALYAYSIRWLYVTDEQSSASTDERHRHLEALKSKLSMDLYHQAKDKVLTSMSRRSYRSVLALFLFATIPSNGHQDDDNLGSLCLETSLNHLYYLNNSTSMSTFYTHPAASLIQLRPRADSPLDRTPEADDFELQKFLSMSRAAFWFGVVTDTTKSLFSCRPSILLPGNSGETKVWSDVRARIQSLDPEFRSLRAQRTPFSNEQVFTILRYAYPLKTLVWATVTQVQDALFHQASGLSVADAVDAAREASNHFEETFGQLLCMCQRDFLFLDRSTQICYTLLNIHFQLGHLVLVDALPADFIFIDRYYTPYDLRLCACRSIVTALKVAIQTEGPHNILLLDPHPELMTNAIIRTGSSILLLHRMRKMSIDTTITMSSVVLKALEVLSKISHTASTAIPGLRQEVEELGLEYSTAPKMDDLHMAVSVTSEIGQSIFQNDVLQYLEQHATAPPLFDFWLESFGYDSDLC